MRRRHSSWGEQEWSRLGYGYVKVSGQRIEGGWT
jgi:hypothetical protein